MLRRLYSTPAHNQRIINVLKTYMEAENKANPNMSYKARAYADAIKSIQLLNYEVHSAQDIQKVKGVGRGIATRIEDFLAGRELHVYDDSEGAILRAKQLAELQRVPGIGPKKASDLHAAGCTTIADIGRPEYLRLLTTSQQTQAKYYEQLRRPVHRTDTEDVMQFIQDNVSAGFQYTPVGAYRRGFDTFPTPTIELMLQHPLFVHVPQPSDPPPSMGSPKITAPSSRHGRKRIAFRSPYSSVEARSSSLLLKEVVRPLESRGLIAATFNVSPSKWQGVIRLPTRAPGGVWTDRASSLKEIQNDEGEYRHLDLSLVPTRSCGAALLALTGDNQFTKDLRRRAADLDMILNEYGLWKWNGIIGSSDEKVSQGFWELVASESEQEIFERLQMDWVAPKDRTIIFHDSVP